MKIQAILSVCVVACAFAVPAGRAQNLPPRAGQNPDVYVAPPIDIKVESESVSLARGYADAFKDLRTPISLTLQRGERLFLIEDVRDVQAYGGAIRVTVGRGTTFYLLNPKDVVAITDGYAPKQVPEPARPASAVAAPVAPATK